MKSLRVALAFALALCLTASIPTSALALTTPGDVSDILGLNPTFTSGYWTDQYGTWYKSVLDSTASTPAAAGKLVSFLPASSTWKQNVTANIAMPFGTYGIVATPASAAGGTANAFIIARGAANALCTTGTAAIAAGSLLVSDASGNLTTPATLAAPSSQTAVPFGTAGAATVSYTLYARNLVSLDSAASSLATSTTSNATLSATNGNVVAATIPAGTYQVVVARTAGGPSQGVIGVYNVSPLATNFSMIDYGIPANAAYAAPTVGSAQIAGTVLAVALAPLAASQPATAVSVLVGGY